MKNIIMRFLLTLMFLCKGYFVFSQQKLDTIYWSPERKLKVEDFNFCIKDTCDKFNADALSHFSIVTNLYWKGNVPFYRIKVGFIKSKSCATDTLKLINLLPHEQLHFDIEALYVMKIKKEIEIYQRKSFLSEYFYQQLIDKLLLERDSIQKKFDFETLRGTDEDAQKVWAGKIKSELEEYTVFFFR